MAGEISLDLMTVMAAMSSDDAKAKVFEDIRAKLKEVVDAKAALDAQMNDFSVQREQARQDRIAVEQMKADAEKRTREIADETAGLASAQMTHQREVEAFGKMRATIESDHDKREKIVKDREGKANDLDTFLTGKAAELDAREAAVSGREGAVERKHAALQQAMAA